MKVFVINGPSLNFLGIREPDVYGKSSYKSLKKEVKKYAHSQGIKVRFFQTNIEGKIVDYIQKAYKRKADGIILNPGAYTHTSIAIRDAVKSVSIKTIEVHLSDITKREEFRKTDYISEVCASTIMGKGIDSYKEAVDMYKK